MWNRRHLFLKPEGDAGAAGGGGNAGNASDSGAGAAGAGAGGGAGASGAAAAGGASAASGAGAGTAGAGAAAAGGAGAAAGDGKAGVVADGKGAASGGAAEAKAATWPENWRETVSRDDAKKLAQLQRYASPEAALQALFAAQERIRSGDLLPKLGKNPSAEELKEWREAHGIPDDPGKYDLGKDVKIHDEDRAFFDVMFKSAHASNQTPQQVRAMVQTWNQIRQAAMDGRAEQDQQFKQEGEDALRAEWGGEYRRNVNLVHGLLDGAGSQKLKDSFLDARLPDGRRIGDSPDAMKMLAGLALIQNPTGVVVPGGDAAREQGIRSELEKLQNIDPRKKTQQQDTRQRELIDAAVKEGLMDQMGNWKK